MQFPQLLFSQPNAIKRKRENGNAGDTRFIRSIRQLGNEVKPIVQLNLSGRAYGGFLHTNVIQLSSRPRAWNEAAASENTSSQSSLRVILNIPAE